DCTHRSPVTRLAGRWVKVGKAFALQRRILRVPQVTALVLDRVQPTARPRSPAERRRPGLGATTASGFRTTAPIPSTPAPVLPETAAALRMLQNPLTPPVDIATIREFPRALE